MSAVNLYRLSRFLWQIGVPVFPRVIDLCNRVVFGCWLPHEATLGRGVKLGYWGLGVVVHPKSVIGDQVEIGHQVTIGGSARAEGAPVVRDRVYIGAGAKLIGGITIGEGAVIGANAVVIRDVPGGCVVVGVPGRVVRQGVEASSYLFHRRRVRE